MRKPVLGVLAVASRSSPGAFVAWLARQRISIDDYSGLAGGGAASQLARKLGLELVDLTCDGNTSQGVSLTSLSHRRPRMS